MDGNRFRRTISIALIVLAALPMTSADAAPPVCTVGVDPGCFPTAVECATGNYNGHWDGGVPGRFADCLASGGHIIHYEAGYQGDENNPACIGAITGGDESGVGATWRPDYNLCPPFSAPPGHGVPGRAFLPAVTSARGVVSSLSPLASRAGIDILDQGGNAMDAAVATAFAVGVTRPELCGGMGGHGSLVYRGASGEVAALPFISATPAALNEPGDRGHSSVGVPGFVAGLAEALGRYGTIGLGRAVEHAWRLADQGFPVSTGLAHYYNQAALPLTAPEETRRVYLRDGVFYYPPDNDLADSTLVLEDYGRSLAAVGTFGPDAFYQDGDLPPFTYRGKEYPAGKSIARLILEEMSSAIPGVWTKEDLSAYRAIWRNPLVGTYRGSEIVTVAPPAWGGVNMLETLNIAEGFPLGSPGWEAHSANSIHVMAEASKLAWADAVHYDDPDFNPTVPTETLISKEYAAKRRALIELNKAKGHTAGNPGGGMAGGQAPADTGGSAGSHTTHVSVIDAQGNAAAVTCSPSDLWGSRVVAPGTGFILNNTMSNWNVAEHKDEPAPGKRPWMAHTPTIVVREGVPILVVGGGGGGHIPLGIVQAITNVVDFNMDVAQALDAARFRVPLAEGSCCLLTLEWTRILPDVQKDLGTQVLAPDDSGECAESGRGHCVFRDFNSGEYHLIVPFPTLHAVGTDPLTGRHTGSSDPRENQGTLAQAPTADLSITKTGPPGRVPTARSMTYTLTVTNNGPDSASGVTVTDQLPSTVTFVSTTATEGSCGESTGTVLCTVGEMASGAIVTIAIVVRPTAAGIITNSASVASATLDLNQGNNADSVDTSICRITSRRSSIPCG